MTKSFGSLGEFALHLAKVEVALYAEMQHGLDRALTAIENTAVSEFGTYQPAVGPFPAWEELAEFTKDDRLKAGYTENDPLLRSGELRDSSGHEVQGLEGVAGSTDPVMVYQEFGTVKIPPRPVWGPAAVRNKEKIQRILGAALAEGLLYGTNIHPSLEYDFKTAGEPALIKP